MPREKIYKVTYSGTRRYDTYTSKKAALDQARYAVRIGNMKSCIYKKGAWGLKGFVKIRCVHRRAR